MIVLGDARDGKYHRSLAKELSEYVRGIKVYDFCNTRNKDRFSNREYLVRIVDEHCGEGSCDLTCPNDPKKFKRDLKKDGKVVLVIRGSYGRNWDSGRLVGLTEQCLEVLKEEEYGFCADEICVVWPHHPWTKQDKIFASDGKLLYGSPITVRMVRRNIKRAGASRILTVLPHDYRREGWIRKMAFPGKEHRVYTDWGMLPEEQQKQLVEIENWDGFAYSIDPMDTIVHYMRTNMKPIDVIVSPDLAASLMSISTSRGLGVWDATMQKMRSRKSEEIRIMEGLTEELVGGKNVCIVDDMIIGGTTAIGGVKQAQEAKAKRISCVTVHGEFVDGSLQKIERMRVPIVSTDTVRNPRAKISLIPDIAERLYSKYFGFL